LPRINYRQIGFSRTKMTNRIRQDQQDRQYHLDRRDYRYIIKRADMIKTRTKRINRKFGKSITKCEILQKQWSKQKKGATGHVRVCVSFYVSCLPRLMK
jgi:hypothetical protein